MTRAEKQAAKVADDRITRAFYATCGGIQINVMDMSAIFRAGRAAIAGGADQPGLEAAVRGFVETIRKN